MRSFWLRLVGGVGIAGWGLVGAPASTPPVSPSVEPTTTTSPTTTSPTTTSPTPLIGPASRSFVVAVSGDVLTHLPVVRAACSTKGRAVAGCDFSSLFTDLVPLLSTADLAICHLEVPIVAPGRPVSGYPLFGAPRSLPAGLAAAGWDRCSTASNHSLDQGPAGITATLDALDGAGLGHSGTARTPAEAESVAFVINGVRVVHLSYAYGFNGLSLPKGQPWRANRIDPVRIVADARRARENGAEVVLVSLHWGLEYRVQPTADQQRVAELVTRDGLVDLIIGHHAHVVQPIGRVNNRWVLWGLGNHVSAQTPSGGRPAGVADGVIVTVRISESAQQRGAFAVGTPVAHPTWVEPASRKVRLVGSDDSNAARRASWARTARTLRQFVVSRSSPAGQTG